MISVVLPMEAADAVASDGGANADGNADGNADRERKETFGGSREEPLKAELEKAELEKSAGMSEHVAGGIGSDSGDVSGEMFRRNPKVLRGNRQGNIGLSLGVAGRSKGEGKQRPTGFWDETRMHLGVHGDLIFGRRSAWDWGVGPFAQVMSLLDDISVGAGVSVHVPVHDFLPIVVSAGSYGRYSGVWNGGVSGRIFWGSRSFNHNFHYIMAMGLVLEGRIGVLGEQKERTMLVALHIDGQAIALPVFMLYEAMGAK